MGSEIKEFKGLQTHLSIMSDFTGSLYRISNNKSSDNRVSRLGASDDDSCLMVAAVAATDD
jgi:hypothetical protein